MVVLVLEDAGEVFDGFWSVELGRTNLITTKAIAAKITNPRITGIKNLNGDFLGVLAGVGASWGGGGGSVGGVNEEEGVEVEGGVETGLSLFWKGGIWFEVEGGVGLEVAERDFSRGRGSVVLEGLGGSRVKSEGGGGMSSGDVVAAMFCESGSGFDP